MRSVIGILIIGGLIYLGWEQPFKQRYDELKAAMGAAGHALEHPTSSETPRTVPPATPAATATATPQPTVPVSVPAPTPRGAWMWDPNHHSVLDRPAYDQTQPVQRYHDQYGRSYWIDANGVRHYDQ
jgi:hypothetical protein